MHSLVLSCPLRDRDMRRLEAVSVYFRLYGQFLNTDAAPTECCYRGMRQVSAATTAVWLTVAKVIGERRGSWYRYNTSENMLISAEASGL